MPDLFTELEYEGLLELAQEKYKFIPYSCALSPPLNSILMRHDVDCSPHRALAMAKIESKHHIKSTYFIHLHSAFYNIFEAPILRVFKDISLLGHGIGLHFDPWFDMELWYSEDNQTNQMYSEMAFLEHYIKVNVCAVSFHNPTEETFLHFPQDTIFSMVNTYSPTIMKNFHYCSDSNGKWREGNRLEDLLKSDKPRLHVLTHPEWWTPIHRTPLEKIQRCIEGRSEYQTWYYQQIMKKYKLGGNK